MSKKGEPTKEPTGQELLDKLVKSSLESIVANSTHAAPEMQKPIQEECDKTKVKLAEARAQLTSQLSEKEIKDLTDLGALLEDGLKSSLQTESANPKAEPEKVNTDLQKPELETTRPQIEPKKLGDATFKALCNAYVKYVVAEVKLFGAWASNKVRPNEQSAAKLAVAQKEVKATKQEFSDVQVQRKLEKQIKKIGKVIDEHQKPAKSFKENVTKMAKQAKEKASKVLGR